MKPGNVGEWLDTPNEAFSGLEPLDLIECGELDRLWRMVFEVESGALTYSSAGNSFPTFWIVRELAF